VRFFEHLHCSIVLKMKTVCLCGVQGSVRRKKKVIIREHVNDEKKIQSVLKKIGLSEIANIDEVAQCTSCFVETQII